MVQIGTRLRTNRNRRGSVAEFPLVSSLSDFPDESRHTMIIVAVILAPGSKPNREGFYDSLRCSACGD